LHSWQASVIFGRTSVAATMECLSNERLLQMDLTG
jgi:hypothetical protein